MVKKIGHENYIQNLRKKNTISWVSVALKYINKTNDIAFELTSVSFNSWCDESQKRNWRILEIVWLATKWEV